MGVAIVVATAEAGAAQLGTTLLAVTANPTPEVVAVSMSTTSFVSQSVFLSQLVGQAGGRLVPEGHVDTGGGGSSPIEDSADLLCPTDLPSPSKRVSRSLVGFTQVASHLFSHGWVVVPGTFIYGWVVLCASRDWEGPS